MRSHVPGLANPRMPRRGAALGAALGLALGLVGVAPQVTLTASGPVLHWLQPAQAGTAAAVDAAQVAALGDAMQLGPLLAVIREEGLAYGDGLDKAMLAGSGGVNWRAEVARIYDPASVRPQLDSAMLKALAEDPATLQAMQDFFASPLGTRVAGLEVQARRAFLDPSAKDAATLAWLEMDEKTTPRAATLHRLIDQLDLIELNVQGTLNANLALYHGLVQGGGLKVPMTDADAAAQVAGGEAQARASAQAWLYPYMALAYQPLSDAELDGYVAFLASESGKKANLAMFHAFDALFAGISHDLGLAVSHQMAGSNI